MQKTLVIMLVVVVAALIGIVVFQKLNQPEPTPIVVNQPVNNQPATNCIKEGEISNNTTGLTCCNSLTRILNGYTGENGRCIFESGSAYQGNPNYICTNCGNGVCGLGENQCNCPTDCK